MIEVNTNRYQFSHGKMPRGRGNWCFYMSRSDNDPNKQFWINDASYAEAKKQAIKKARELGVTIITVGS